MSVTVPNQQIKHCFTRNTFSNFQDKNIKNQQSSQINVLGNARWLIFEVQLRCTEVEGRIAYPS